MRKAIALLVFLSGALIARMNNFNQNRLIHKVFVILLSTASISLFSSCMTYERRAAESEWIGDFSYGYAVCKQDGKEFLIDKNGRKVSGKYDRVIGFKNGWAVAYIEDVEPYKITLIDSLLNAKECFTWTATYSEVNSNGNMWVNIGGAGVALVNAASGNRLTDIYGWVNSVDDDGYAVISRTEESDVKDLGGSNYLYFQYAIFDASGTQVVPFGRYSYIGNLSDGLPVQYSENGYLSVQEVNGEATCNLASFNWAYGNLRKEMSSLRKKLKYLGDYEMALMGYMNKRGEPIIEPQYHIAKHFNHSGYAKVAVYDIHNRKTCYIIDTLGHKLSGEAFYIAEASYLEDGYWLAYKRSGNEYLIANNKGEAFNPDPGSELATAYSRYESEKSSNQYIISRKGRQYKLYKAAKGSDRPEYMCMVNGRSPREIVYIADGEKQLAIAIPTGRNWRYNIYLYRLEDGMLLREMHETGLPAISENTFEF